MPIGTENEKKAKINKLWIQRIQAGDTGNTRGGIPIFRTLPKFSILEMDPRKVLAEVGH
jgi:ribosomal protein L20